MLLVTILQHDCISTRQIICAWSLQVPACFIHPCCAEAWQWYIVHDITSDHLMLHCGTLTGHTPRLCLHDTCTIKQHIFFTPKWPLLASQNLGAGKIAAKCALWYNQTLTAMSQICPKSLKHNKKENYDPYPSLNVRRVTFGNYYLDTVNIIIALEWVSWMTSTI